jgi:hypothetical protein
MSAKSNLIVGLAAVVISGALVFDGISRHHNDNSTAVALQNMPAQPVVRPADPGNIAIDPAADSAAATTDASRSTDSTDTAETQDTDRTNTDTTAAENDALPVQPVQTAVLRTVHSPGKKAKQVVASADSTTETDTETAAPAEPVRHIVIPTGTTLNIRLSEELGSKISEDGQSFSGTLDQDVVVGGQTVMPAGSIVSGKVISARPVGALHGEAELQLKLTSVKVNNTNVHVATSTQSFGPQIKGKSKVGKFFKGLAKRAEGDEREVVLAENSAYSFTLQKSLQLE